MKIKWCVSDIDGTITNSDKEIDPRIIDAVARYEEAGGLFILATGRSILTAREVVEKFGLAAPVISGNGSVIQYVGRHGLGATLLCRKIPAQPSLCIAEYAAAEGLDFIAFSGGSLWYPHNSVKVEYFIKRNKERNLRIPMTEFSKPGELPHGEVVKFFLWNMDEGAVRDFEANCNREKAVNCVQSVRGSLDVDPAGATKGSGLRLVAEHLGMKLEHTAAVGDNQNDLDMLMAVGYPVAVANAEDALKRIAWRVCPSNDDCGVAEVLDDFVRDEC